MSEALRGLRDDRERSASRGGGDASSAAAAAAAAATGERCKTGGGEQRRAQTLHVEQSVAYRGLATTAIRFRSTQSTLTVLIDDNQRALGDGISQVVVQKMRPLSLSSALVVLVVALLVGGVSCSRNMVGHLRRENVAVSPLVMEKRERPSAERIARSTTPRLVAKRGDISRPAPAVPTNVNLSCSAFLQCWECTVRYFVCVCRFACRLHWIMQSCGSGVSTTHRSLLEGPPIPKETIESP